MLAGGQRSREAVVPRLIRGIHYVVVLRVCVRAMRVRGLSTYQLSITHVTELGKVCLLVIN